LRTSRLSWASAAVAVCLLAPLMLLSDALAVRLEAGSLRFTAPGFTFLAGRPLERLRDGATVFFDFQVILSASPRASPRRRAATRFAVSYDLWEEKFSVTHWQEPKESASQLSQAAAQSWCLDRLRLAAGDLDPKREFWVRIETRALDPREEAPAVEGGGVSLTHLIDFLSRPNRDPQNRWSIESGPLRLEQLKR
jgi:hypothetical protein